MSRFYEIIISDPKNGDIFVPNIQGKPGFSRQKAGSGAVTYSSLYSGTNPMKLGSANANAQQIELVIPVGVLHQPIGNSYVKIFGVSLQEIAQWANLSHMNFFIRGGMSKGLPLANPTQIGPLASGQILQCFGNWIGTEQSLNFYVQAGGSSALSNQTTGNPATADTLPLPSTNKKSSHIVFQWLPGQHLMDAIKSCLSAPFPQYQISGSISPNLVWTGTAATGFYAKLSQFAQYINKATINLIGGYAPDIQAYPGVMLALHGNTILVSDCTTKTKPKQLQIQDLIGQPTLVAPFEIQATVALRGDISPLDYVTLPLGQMGLSNTSQSSFVPPPNIGGINTNANVNAKNSSVYTGSFLVTEVCHVGRSRQADGASWVTTINMLMSQPADTTSTVAALPVVQTQNTNAYEFYLPGKS
ncbi:hypothetical protein [Paraburkholderia sediminicola]|uniref:hypothetical protein n=1 Tax=Paraburkholderia sediminicola TaxID=458836 RepID=UPI0038B85D75